MNELLNQLIEKARVECEEAQRALLAALNGLAGIANINQHYDEALQLYRRGTLHSLYFSQSRTNEYTQTRVMFCASLGLVIAPKEVDADPLQLIHAYHNLAKTVEILLQQHTPNNAIESECGDLTVTHLQKEREECINKENELKQKYLERYQNKVVTEIHNFRSIVNKVEEMKANIFGQNNVWWVTVLDYLESEPSLVCTFLFIHFENNP
jgi:hypothetical protein